MRWFHQISLLHSFLHLFFNKNSFCLCRFKFYNKFLTSAHFHPLPSSPPPLQPFGLRSAADFWTISTFPHHSHSVLYLPQHHYSTATNLITVEYWFCDGRWPGDQICKFLWFRHFCSWSHITLVVGCLAIVCSHVELLSILYRHAPTTRHIHHFMQIPLSSSRNIRIEKLKEVHTHKHV